MKDTPITAELVRELCARGEGSRLDFKRDPPYGDWKSKGRLDFLKDLISLANSVPAGDATAHLLLGVAEEEPERFGKVTGFQPEPHISDAGLHEVCVGTLNRVPPFRYQLVEVDGHLVGVVELGSGERPYFLIREGNDKLRRNVAYYREGSRNTEASPQQVVQWAREDGALRLHSLQVEALEVQLTPDLRIKVEHGGRSGSLYHWGLKVRNAGETRFDVVSVAVKWYSTPQLEEWARTHGRPGVAAGTDVPGPFPCAESIIPAVVEPGQYLETRIKVEADFGQLMSRLRLQRPGSDPVPRQYFRGVVAVCARHRTGREDVKSAVLPEGS